MLSRIGTSCVKEITSFPVKIGQKFSKKLVGAVPKQGANQPRFNSRQGRSPLSARGAKPRCSATKAQAGWLGSMMGGGGGGEVSEIIKTEGPAFRDTAPSWDELAAQVAEQQAQLGMEQNPDLQAGPTSAKTLLRTFGSSEEPRVVFYRDHASWCPYCHKIWLQLEEKQIPYTVKKINMNCYGDKPREFLAKVPRGLLPAMEIDGQMYTESAVIAAKLETLFPEKKRLLPAQGTQEYQTAQQLFRLERELFGRWMNWLTSAGGDKLNRAGFVAVLDDVDDALAASEGDFFLGKELSLVDITFVPFLERMAASLYYYKGLRLAGGGSGWPALQRWWKALDQRSTFRGMKSDYFTHCHDLPPQLGGCAFNEEGRKIAEKIDGEDGTSWHLPLAPLNWDSVEPISWEETSQQDRVEAAAAVVGNYAAVVRFAARGCVPDGPRPVRAPLADPSAELNVQDVSLPAVDAGLRLVVAALLAGKNKEVDVEKAGKVGDDTDALSCGRAVAGAIYLRDRVGVPRDMSFPAARQLRAHLNSLADSLSS